MKIKTATGSVIDVKDETTAQEIIEHTGWSAEGETSEKKSGRKAPDTSND